MSRQRPLSSSQILMVKSSLALASHVPVELKMTWRMRLLCPDNLVAHVPVWRFHKWIAPSLLPAVASRSP
ncbi:hypothetical protein [Chamaesiphon polymorphus]|uniref:hypothetical protein n=1 Tax=Chamaesiphon polymorphus TaxID=2107691 RepID=UPI001FECB154|nr:hypothetical protein [Chamaesiphon polymorphus]